jgi:hypothetical protein
MDKKNVSKVSNEYIPPKRLEERVKRAYHFRKEDFIPIIGVKNYIDRCDSGLIIYNHWLDSQSKKNSKKGFGNLADKLEIERKINDYSNKSFIGNCTLIAYNLGLFGGLGFVTIKTIEQLLK